MKITKIRFKNLNSLVGEWEIDFRHPAYTSQGIFAITGPTGAGKTTILDALCLGLYGQTPRLQKISKSSNEIMSRQTGECFAEVTFETQAGRFRSHWSQRRARKKAEGELQPPKHEIADADTGKILEAKSKGVASQIESVTGMNFDRFTRSMLLAQGSFASFLQASPDDRAPILEQITGTEIYSKISIRVHERLREIREKMQALEAGIAGIMFLSPDEESETRKQLASASEQEAHLRAELMKTAEAVSWLKCLQELGKEGDRLALEFARLQEAINSFEPQRQKLARAQIAASWDGPYATLTTLRKQQIDDQSVLSKNRESLPDLEASATQMALLLQKAEAESAEAKDALKSESQVIQNIRLLDQKIAEQKRALTEQEASLRKIQDSADSHQSLKEKEEQKLALARQSQVSVDLYLEEHACDEWLISGLAGIEEQIGSLRAGYKEVESKQLEEKKAYLVLERASIAHLSAQKHREMRQKEFSEFKDRLASAHARLERTLEGKLLREYHSEFSALLRESEYLKRIASLTEHRKNLINGQPCPLCGAEEHPYAVGNIPSKDETDLKLERITQLIKKAEDEKALIETLESTEHELSRKISEAEKIESDAHHAKAFAEKGLADLKTTTELLADDLTEKKQGLLKKLTPLGVINIEGIDLVALLSSLKVRLQNWQLHLMQKMQTEKLILSIENELQKLVLVLENDQKNLLEKRDTLENYRRDFSNLRATRKDLYSDRNPDEEEWKLESLVKSKEKSEKEAGRLHFAAQQRLNTAKGQLEILRDQIEQRSAKLLMTEAEFRAAIKESFADEQDFKDASLRPDERGRLMAQAQELSDRQAEMRARSQDYSNRRSTETAKALTSETLEELIPRHETLEVSLHSARELIAGLNHKLNENTKVINRLKDQQAAIDILKKEYERWHKLHELIGSADGKKYRNFAQGLTFEVMVRFANRQLQKMTDRYLLVRDENQPLELNVIDNYQAGEKRSTKNLSGGESFIVSLALALGLSHMSSKNVRVDSLFLDEGFGTLDEDALNVALETLSGLHKVSKLIGVISHVSALKERISTQIQVAPLPGGRSRVFGPGCQALISREDDVADIASYATKTVPSPSINL